MASKALGALLALGIVLNGSARAGGWYFGPEGGLSVLGHQTGELTTPPLPQFGPGPTRFAPFQFPISETFSTGSNAGGRVGYEWSAWRFEEEYRHQQNDLRSANFVGSTGGHRNAHAVMTNAIYEGLGLGWPLAPHLGIGVGAVDVQDELTTSGGSTTLRGPTSSFGSTGSGTAFHDQQWAFGYQGIAGARYEITPAVAVDLDYRYLATPGLKLHTPASSRLLGGLSYSASYATHNVVLSLIFRLDEPTPDMEGGTVRNR